MLIMRSFVDWKWLIFGLGLVFVFAWIWKYFDTRRLIMDRTGENFETFKKHFYQLAISEDCLLIIYNYFQEWMCGKKMVFPVRASDNIIRTYGIVDKDFEDLLKEILSRCNKVMPTKIKLDEIQTVKDLVLFIKACSSKNYLSK